MKKYLKPQLDIISVQTECYCVVNVSSVTNDPNDGYSGSQGVVDDAIQDLTVDD